MAPTKGETTELPAKDTRDASQRLLDALPGPEWLQGIARTLIETAESLFIGEKRGAKRKRWVVKSLQTVTEDLGIDVPELVIEFVVEFVFRVMKAGR